MKKVNFSPLCAYELQSVTENKSSESSESVYNIQVSADHSYLVNGFVVKNCRCVWNLINPTMQYIDKDGSPAMRAMDEKAWQKFYDAKVKPIEEQMIKYGVMK